MNSQIKGLGRQTARLLAFLVAVTCGGALAQSNVGPTQSLRNWRESGLNLIPINASVSDIGTVANPVDAIITDDLTVNDVLTVTNDLNITDDVTVTSDLAVNGNTALGNAATDTITITGASTASMAMTADSAATNKTLDLNITSPVDTTGTNSHYALQIDATIGNASGGTNTVRGINIAAITGDAQVNVDAIAIGAGTVLGTGRGLFIDGGWDSAVEIDVEATADSGQTSNGIDIDLTSPVDTTGTNSHFGLNIDTTVGNASGGTNVVAGVNIANVTGDAQVTENAIQIGTGWDAPMKIGTVSGVPPLVQSGTTLTKIWMTTDTDLDNGQTSEVVALTGLTASSRCVAIITNDSTNEVSVTSAVTTTDQVTVQISADPGASGADLCVICFE